MENLKKYTYKTELHAHTYPVSQCSEISPEHLVEVYSKLGYTSVTVTNHFSPLLMEYNSAKKCADFYLQDFKTAEKRGKELGISVILGMEIRFEGKLNDYLVYGIDEGFVEKAFYYLDKTLEEFYKGMKGEGCLILQAHPFRKNCTLANPRYLDGIETYNMHPNHNSPVAHAVKAAKEHDFIATAGSDYHHPHMEGLTSILSKHPIRNSFDLVKLLESRDYLIDICGDLVLPYF